MESSREPTGFGRRFLLIVVLGAVVPLGAIGLWMSRSAARSGRDLLRSQLESQLAQTANELDQRWQQYRSDLLTLGENEPVRLALTGRGTSGSRIPLFIQKSFAQMPELDHVEIRDRAGRTRFTLGSVAEIHADNGRNAERGDDARGVNVQLPLTDLTSGDTIGVIEATLRVAELLPSATQLAAPSGPNTALFAGGRASVPAGADARLFSDETVVWSGHHWMTVRRQVSDPPLELAMAGALEPYIGLFEAAATKGAAALVLAASGIVVVVATLTRRIAREVERELAQRDALAAVGEFASELAHEVRNPLTAIRLDLQRLDEAAIDSEVVRGIMPRVLQQFDRLDRAVAGALQVTRGGSMKPRPVDIREVLESARRAADPAFTQRGARVIMTADSGKPLYVKGDASALEQLFLNLLINAAHSLAPKGEAHVCAAPSDGSVEVTIADTGIGMTPAELDGIRKPFRSSRRDGTGLGLKIARRIVASHNGRMEMRSSRGVGTTVSVRLPEA